MYFLQVGFKDETITIPTNMMLQGVNFIRTEEKINDYCIEDITPAIAPYVIERYFFNFKKVALQNTKLLFSIFKLFLPTPNYILAHAIDQFSISFSTKIKTLFASTCSPAFTFTSLIKPSIEE